MSADPYVLSEGEGQTVWSLGGRFTMKLTGAESDGRFSVTEALAFRSTEPPLHIHHSEDEAWYLLDGQMTFHIADKIFVATAGSFVFRPSDVPHAFTVDKEPTRVLVFAGPAGFERFAIELGEPGTSETPPEGFAMPSPEILGPVAARYNIEVVGPPVRAV